MIGDAVLYAASRATHTALENVSRRLAWIAIAALFLLAAFVLAVIALYLVLEPQFGPLRTIAAIACGATLIGIICLSMPWFINRMEVRSRDHGSPTANAVAAVDQEAKEAVDYFGAIQVVGTAFLLD